MGDVEIRPAKPEEWDYAMELAFRVFLKFEAEEYGKAGTESFAEFVTSESLRKAFLAGHYILLVAICDDKIVGMISARNINHISLLFVDSAYHRMKIGTKLLDNMAYYLVKKEGCIEMTVNSSPYAVEFYHRNGFVDTSEQTVQDNIIYTPMTKHLV